MKKHVYAILIALLTFSVSSAFAMREIPKEITLHVQFDSKPNSAFYQTPLHFNKTVTINTAETSNVILMEKSDIANNFPVTVVMFVQPSLDKENHEATFKFNLVHYGYMQSSSIISQPTLIVLNGQPVEMKNSAFTLKATAHWRR